MSHAFRRLRFYLSPSTAKPRFFLSSTSVRRQPTAPPPPPPPPPHSVARASTVTAVFLRRLQFPLSPPLLRIHLLRRTSTAPPPTPLQHPFCVTAAWRAAIESSACAHFYRKFIASSSVVGNFGSLTDTLKDQRCFRFRILVCKPLVRR